MKNIFLKSAFSLALILMVSSMAFAQSFSIKVRLTDSGNGEPVSYATVSVSKEGSTKVLKYAQTDDAGNATISGLAGGRYVVKGIMMGYDDFVRTVAIEGKNLDLGNCRMKVQVNYLEGATVTSVGNTIVVKKDTIEHNVSLMKQTDSDMLEDILKRLPGVEVDENGKVTANGKEITKIYIDGKAFFLDDPKLATKNLPAKIINKVKIVDKKSDQAEFTGIDDGDEETVLDLNVKPGMMNGWMGNVTGGMGADVHSSDEKASGAENKIRYQGGGMAARFSKSDQLVFLGNINNTNNRGFNDIMGNAMGGMRRGGMRGGNNGISTSYMAGVNGTKIFDDKSELNGNYLFNGNERVVEETTDRVTFKEDGSQLIAHEDSHNSANSYGHRLGARIDWKLSKQTSILFMPQFNIGHGDFADVTDYFTKMDQDGTRRDVNDGWSKAVGDSHNKNAGGRILFRQRIGKARGRTISLNMNYNFEDKDMDGINQSRMNVYDGGLPEDTDQQFFTDSKSWRLGGRLSYTEPLGRNFFAEATYSYNYTKSSSDKTAYNKDEDGKYTIFDSDYSSFVENQFIQQNIGLSIRKQEKKVNATIGANYMPSHTISHTTYSEVDTTIDRSVYNWSPNARIDFNFSDSKVLRLRYRGRTSQPSTSQLLPVPDNSDPQKIQLGNPGLTPSFSHNVHADYRYNNKESFFSSNINGDFSYSTNNIVTAAYYGSDGVQYTIPMNNDKGALSASIYSMINSPIAKSNFSIMSFTMLNYGKGVNLVGKDIIDPEDPDSYLNIKNYTENDYQSASVTERLRFMYRNDIFEAAVGGRIRYTQSWYTVATQNVDPAWTNSVDARFIANIPKVLNISTDCTYTFYAGYSADFNKPMCVWNAELSKQIFKNKATIAVKMYDILNQSRSISRTATDNYVLDKMNNTLGRYFMATLTWRLGNFGEGSKKLHQGMGGHGYHGRR